MWQPPPSPRIQFIQPPVIQSQGPTVERLEQLSHLVTTRVLVADVLVGEGNGCKGAWLIRGDAIIAVNLGQAAVVEKNETTKRATIRLPLPEVLQARVDHERTQIWELRTTTWILWAADKDSLRDAVVAHAQRLVSQAAGSPENIQQAKAAAESAIRGLYAEVGWQVSIAWGSPPTDTPKTASATK
jgi:hypothetical protein